VLRLALYKPRNLLLGFKEKGSASCQNNRNRILTFFRDGLEVSFLYEFCGPFSWKLSVGGVCLESSQLHFEYLWATNSNRHMDLIPGNRIFRLE
jgi:hypothetical protein